MARAVLSEQPAPNNCAINEVTGDGTPVGRCWHHLPDGKTCPRHGDVSVPQDHYRRTGKLTLEKLVPDTKR